MLGLRKNWKVGIVVTLLMGSFPINMNNIKASENISDIELPLIEVGNQFYDSQITPQVFNTLEEATLAGADHFIVLNDSNARYLGGYTEYVYKRQAKLYTQKDVGFHPDFTRYRCNVNSYGFSTTKKRTYTVQVDYKNVSVTVSTEAASGSFFTIPANASKCSRPYVKADIYAKYYDVKYYNEFGQLFKTDSEAHVVRNATNENIYVKYQ
ncbi:hypothetical protein [Turicibacter bilis]|uniref:hypothetical protein n=1 Tax=Turicibacter bilis TaxID=2735723 RepID=UPI001BAED4AB|nr:hypothetical protein [Turicibacter bilis]MBS3199210.1 hypothetical protein [Turicibacter bilis]